MADLSLLPPSASIDGPDLRIGGCSLTEVAAEFGTPAFVIDEQALRDRARAYREGLAARHPRSRVCFAMKSFPSASMVSVLASVAPMAVASMVVRPWLANCQLAKKPRRSGFCSARNAVALPNSPPAEKPWTIRAATIRIGANSPIDE